MKPSVCQQPIPIIDIIHSGENLKFKSDVKQKMPAAAKCQRCGYISSMEICKACLLLEGLNKGLPKLGIGKSSKSIRDKREQDGEGADTAKTANGSCGSCACKSEIQKPVKGSSAAKDLSF